MGIFQRGSPMVSVKEWRIFFSVFFSKRVLEIIFSYGLERKEAFEVDKNVNFFKSKKMGIFQRGSPMVQVKKSAIFSSVFFSKIGQKIIFSYCLERKEPYEDDKNVKFFKSKKRVFSKGVHPWFRSKSGEFFLVCFSASESQK